MANISVSPVRLSYPIDLIEHLDWEVCVQWLRTPEMHYNNLQLCLFSQPELEL